ncbi:hypothetical protein ACHAXA_002866 [Cyclostephanos tholiformis]|uniref:TFIIS central domain-containing protein n=1 Tax=Cyclostephanos tholiformis TaxID=382380 RepID=A0ABD3SBE9_9STRA
MTPNEGVGGDDSTPYSPDDLIELVRAIKFAHTDMSIRNVHHEISVTMAKSDASYAFLKDVKLNDVKKVWKKALKGSANVNNLALENETALRRDKDAARVQTVIDETIVPQDGVIKFYTVGDGSVKTLVENYSNQYAEEAVANSRQQKNEETEPEGGGGGYAHFFLDVPADLSGSRPHQALINYQENKKAGKAKGKSAKSKKAAARSCDDDDGNIYKIQLAALPPGMEDLPTPMLLYNADRSAKTFIHPPSPSDDNADDGGYFRIRNLIVESGESGALGTTGGQKAYFYGFITKTTSGQVISIQTTELAPFQTW